jgi:hypothetical protein
VVGTSPVSAQTDASHAQVATAAEPVPETLHVWLSSQGLSASEQGLLATGAVAQVAPVKPLMQAQLKVPSDPVEQTPPFLHGSLEHTVVLAAQDVLPSPV